MVNQEIANQASDALAGLINELSIFTDEQFNQQPGEGWTAGEIAQHLILANGGFAASLNGNVIDVDRDPAQNVEIIKETFTNYGIKLQSPPFIVPELKKYDKHEQLQTLQKIKEDSVKAIKELDLDKLCMNFEVPVWGPLTRLEAATLLIYHTQRHIHQLRNIYEKIS